MVHVHTKIWAIKASAKGWSEFQWYYFNKEKAINCLKELQENRTPRNKINYRLYEINTDDALIYNE